MPEGLTGVIVMLAAGYLLLLLELFVPGGVVGIVGVVAVLFGCYLAWEMGPFWGLGAIVFSFAVTAIGVKVFFASRAGKRLVLKDARGSTWKSQDESLEALVGRRGLTLTSLRPAGMAEIDGERVDVVSDSEFLDAGQEIQVVEVEGSRVVVARPEVAEASLSAPDATDPGVAYSEGRDRTP